MKGPWKSWKALSWW